MNIDKLNIKPIERIDGWSSNVELSRPEDVDKLEQQNKEMLKYLIESMLDRIVLWISTLEPESIEEITDRCEKMNSKLISIIERISGMSWPEIKKLLE